MQTNIKKYGTYNGKENKIKFSHNWNNKLGSKFFTTIRKMEVYNYYEPRINEIFDVYLTSKFLCKAMLKDVSLTNIDKITPELLVLDTGTMDYKKLFEKFHVKDNCTLLLFERVEL